MDEKERLLSEFRKLGEKTRNLKDFLDTKEFEELCTYYKTLSMNRDTATDMAICNILSEVEGIYIKGTLMHILQSAYGTSLEVVYNFEDLDGITGFTPILRNRDRKYLEGIRPQDGVIIVLDFEYEPNGITYYATKISKMDKMYQPIKICPICKQIYDARDGQVFYQFNSTTCCICSTNEKAIELIEVDNTNDLYKILDK